MRHALLICLLICLASCNRETVQLKKTPIPVHVTAIESYKPGGGQPYSASILPNRQVNLGFRVGGFVDSILQVRGADGRMRSVDFGDTVQQGTRLARVRQQDYELQVSQATGQLSQARDAQRTAQAQLEQTEAAALKAQQDFERASSLFSSKSLTKSDYDAAKANYDATKAQVAAARYQAQATAGTVQAAQAATGSANLGLHDTDLTAPFAGVIVQRSVDNGSLVGSGTLAFVLADIHLVKASIGVPDTIIPTLKNGSRLTIYAEAFPNRQFQGAVSNIAAVADSSTRSFQVDVTISNERSLLKPGMIVSLDLGGVHSSKSVLVAPLNAIVRSNDSASQFAVMVVSGGKVKRQPVSLGATYGDHIGVTGVQPGTMVISSGATLVDDGDAVEVIP
jgi:RND family efflux transporter MFP subunit